MRGMSRAVTLSRVAVAVVAALIIAYLALLAYRPHAADSLPTPWRYFGQPGSFWSLAIAAAALAAACLQLYRSTRGRRSGAPIAIVLVLSAAAFVLAVASYAPCNAGHTKFFTQLIWGAALVKGGMGDVTMAKGTCPTTVPIALELARLSALSALFISLLGIAAAVFQARMDRLRVFFANSVTAVVGVDDDAQTMVGAISGALDPGSTLVLISATPDGACEQQSRAMGARIVSVDLDQARSLTSLTLWRRLNRLYLLSADPWTNLQRLSMISDRMSAIGKHRRIPLIVRIDDPWQAEAWRAQQFGGSDSHWVADAVGMYEVTARRLLDRILASSGITRIVIAGSSPLTLALLADVARRQAEHDFYPDERDAPMPAVTLVAENSDEYRDDHERHREESGLPADRPRIDAVTSSPSVRALSQTIAERGSPDATAVIFVDSDPTAGFSFDPTAGIRLASRFPTTAVYAWDPKARVTEDRVPLVGKLRTYRLAMDLPKGQAHDAWERAARLIHERYAAEAGYSSESTRPWAQLDEFYRGSNRRLLRNALWMVEQIAEHTWSSRGAPGARGLDEAMPDLANLEPLEQLQRLGIGRKAALAMARAEHEDWCRYYRAAGWKYGPVRDNAHKITDKLVDWSQVESDPQRLRSATASVAATLLALRELGYRSRPVWQRYRRSGTVLADQRHEPWTWTTSSGETMRANAGDWAVEGGDGQIRSVADDIFRATHTQESGRRWRRCGEVEARPARHGEVIRTLEGPAKASDGDWVVRGTKGEMWPVPAAEFTSGYEGPLRDPVPVAAKN